MRVYLHFEKISDVHMDTGVKKVVAFVIIIGTSLLSVSFAPKQKPVTDNLKELITNIFTSIGNVKTLRYNLQCNERINGRMQHTESLVKLQVSPRKLYLSLKGPELLWIQGANNGNALVNPDAFPYMNLNLDPNGSLMRKNQHHTINEMGLQYLADILRDGIKRTGDKLSKYVVLLGEEKYDDRSCYKLSISFPDFKWISYTTKEGEDVVSVARKFYLSEYMILENNPQISDYTDVKAGQIIKIPDAYAKLTLLTIDKELMLPVNNKVFDDKGLFEMYEYHNVIVNSPIAPEEFTKDYKDYNF